MMGCAMDEEVKNYVEQRSTGPISTETFRMAYQHPPSHPWNQCAADFFSRMFLSAIEANWFSDGRTFPSLTKEKIKLQFLNRFYDIKKKWKSRCEQRTPAERAATEQKHRRDHRRNTACSCNFL